MGDSPRCSTLSHCTARANDRRWGGRKGATPQPRTTGKPESRHDHAYSVVYVLTGDSTVKRDRHLDMILSSVRRVRVTCGVLRSASADAFGISHGGGLGQGPVVFLQEYKVAPRRVAF